nr:hypothetical protein [Caldicellulosiruptor bescii]
MSYVQGKMPFYIFDEAKKKDGVKAYFVSKDECLDVLKEKLQATVQSFLKLRGA